MLIAPFNTDAPIYHRPIATVTFIVINVIMFFATTFQLMIDNVDEESLNWLILMFDQINPLQWITSAFMHGDFSHLIGNMIFLWSFGLVVEGKIGTPRFTLLYLGLAAAQSAIVQVPMFLLGAESGALGASGAIFAIMVIAVIWAPENEMDCFYWIGLIWWGTFEIRIFSLGMIFIGLQVFMLWLNDFSMSSAMLHMAGVAVGVPAAFYMLRQDLVDCEGWDVVSRNPWLQDYRLLYSDEQRIRHSKTQQTIDDPIAAALSLDRPNQQTSRRAAGGARIDRPSQPAPKSRRTGVQSKSPQSRKRSASSSAQSDVAVAGHRIDSSHETSGDRARKHPDFNGLRYMLRQAIEANNVAAAQQAFTRLDQKQLMDGLSEKLLFQLVTFLGQNNKYIEAIRPLTIVAGRGGANADDARLRIAQIQLKVLNNPTAAIRTLSAFSPLRETSTELEQKRFAKRNELLAAAKRMT